MRFARIVFTCAGVWGLVALVPLYFSADVIGKLYPPAITHPDFFFGFVGVAVAWQLAFLLIGRNPVGLHAMMGPAIAEKFIYVFTLTALYGNGSLQFGQFVVAVPDFVFGVLFVTAFFKVQGSQRLPLSPLDYSGVVGD